MEAKDLTGFFEKLSEVMEGSRAYLIKLDSVVGDGDLGLTMGDGFAAAWAYVKECGESDIGKLLYGAGKAMSTAVPSTMGTLMASGWMRAGKELKGKTQMDGADFTAMFEAYLAGVADRGKAKVGDKTFLDGLSPAVDVMKQAQGEEKAPGEIAALAYEAAVKGFQDTTTMVAVHGRAATRGEASRELEDPGAAVAMLMMQAYKEWLAK